MSKPKIKRLYLIPILSKALDVLELLEHANGSIALEDVYQQTGISKTSIYRILKTLVHRGYVAQGEGGQYRLVSRPRRLRFGFAAQSSEMPFSLAVTSSVTAAAAKAGVELLHLDNRYDPDLAIKNAEEFVRQRVDLVSSFRSRNMLHRTSLTYSRRQKFRSSRSMFHTPMLLTLALITLRSVTRQARYLLNSRSVSGRAKLTGSWALAFLKRAASFKAG